MAGQFEDHRSSSQRVFSLPAGPARLYTPTARAKSNHSILYPLMKKLQWRRGHIAGGSGCGLRDCAFHTGGADPLDETM
jgi:hypothetical protein